MIAARVSSVPVGPLPRFDAGTEEYRATRTAPAHPRHARPLGSTRALAKKGDVRTRAGTRGGQGVAPVCWTVG
jgi:hypothetical protein